MDLFPAERTARAVVDLVANVCRRCGEHIDPGAAGEVEDCGQVPDADARVDASLWLPKNDCVAVGIAKGRLVHG